MLNKHYFNRYKTFYIYTYTLLHLPFRIWKKRKFHLVNVGEILVY